MNKTEAATNDAGTVQIMIEFPHILNRSTSFKSCFFAAVVVDDVEVCVVKTIPSSLLLIVASGAELLLVFDVSLFVKPGVGALEKVDTGGQF